MTKLLYEAFWDTHYYRLGSNLNNFISVTEVTQCLRLSYYFRVIPKESPSMLFLLAGSAFHEHITKVAAERYGFEREKTACTLIDMPNGDSFKFCGKADLFDPSTRTLIEIKFVNKLPKEPYDEHIMQTCIYKYLFNASKVFIVYFARKDKGGRPEIRVFEVYACESDYKKAVERAKTLYWALQNKILPKAEKGVYCQYCPYRYQCMKNYNPFQKESSPKEDRKT